MSRTDDFRKHTYTPGEFYDYMKQIEKAMAGDIVLACVPDTLKTPVGDITAAVTDEEKYEVEIKVVVKDSDDNIHEWLNADLDVAVVASTAGDGTATIKDNADEVEIRKGVGTVIVEYDGTWAEGDTSTLTVTGGTFAGVSTGNKTSVDTIDDPEEV